MKEKLNEKQNEWAKELMDSEELEFLHEGVPHILLVVATTADAHYCVFRRYVYAPAGRTLFGNAF